MVKSLFDAGDINGNGILDLYEFAALVRYIDPTVKWDTVGVRLACRFPFAWEGSAHVWCPTLTFLPRSNGSTQEVLGSAVRSATWSPTSISIDSHGGASARHDVRMLG